MWFILIYLIGHNQFCDNGAITHEKNLLIEGKAGESLRCFADGERLIYYSHKRNDNSTSYHYYYYDLLSQANVDIGVSDNFAVISEITDDKIYLSFNDRATGELLLGYIMKDDFYTFEFDKVRPLKLEYSD